MPAEPLNIPGDLIHFKYPLPHLAKALQGAEPVRIVAIGSSSTAGRLDDVPYSARLEMYLRDQFPNLKIDVLNRGKGGEEAVEELLRFDADIFAEEPSLVIWQVGTNAVFHNYDLKKVATKIAEGLDRLHGQLMDVVLIDPQYVPAMLFDNKAEASESMVSLIAAAAKKAGVNVFHRWALMRHWHVHNNIGLDRFIDPTDPDKLHMSDWCTDGVTQALTAAITDAVGSGDGFSARPPDRRRATDGAGGSSRQNSEHLVDLLIASTRRPGPQLVFTNRWCAELSYAAAQVSVPKSHRIGKVERPWTPTLFGWTIYREPEKEGKHFVLKGLSRLNEQEFLNSINFGGPHEALIFVHGFNNTFDDAIFRAAQIVWDTQFQGVPILFSWPSKGRVRSYPYDAICADLSIDGFSQLLDVLMARTSLTRIHVVSHSMGSQIAMNSLARFALSQPSWTLGEIVFAAPDVNWDAFTKHACHIHLISRGVTLYASAVDKALVASRTFAEGDRAGGLREGRPIVVPNVESIDATAVGKELFGLGHSTFATKRPLIDDIGRLISIGDRPPHVRSPQIRGMPEDEGTPIYWKFAN
jgi:esterase/lipase superfamily enzyme